MSGWTPLRHLVGVGPAWTIRRVAGATTPRTPLVRSCRKCTSSAQGAQPPYPQGNLQGRDQQIVARGPLRTDESDKRAHGNSPEHRGDPHTKLNSGSLAPRSNRRSWATPESKHFHPPATGRQASPTGPAFPSGRASSRSRRRSRFARIGSTIAVAVRRLRRSSGYRGTG